MPHVMSLEGPQLSRVDQIRARLYARTPAPALRGLGTIDQFVAPFKAHPIILLLGIAGGLWYGAKKLK